MCFGVPLTNVKPLIRKDMFTKSTLAKCGLLDEVDQVRSALPRVVGTVASLVNELNLFKTQN